MKSFCLLPLLLLFANLPLQASEVSSPDGSIRVNFELQGTVPTYSVTYQGKPIILPSRLGYDLDKKADLLDGFTLLNEERSTFKTARYATITTNYWYPSHKLPKTAT